MDESPYVDSAISFIVEKVLSYGDDFIKTTAQAIASAKISTTVVMKVNSHFVKEVSMDISMANVGGIGKAAKTLTKVQKVGILGTAFSVYGIIGDFREYGFTGKGFGRASIDTALLVFGVAMAVSNPVGVAAVILPVIGIGAGVIGEVFKNEFLS